MKSILITGASRGIGRGIAEKLSTSGYEVILHCNSRVDAAQDALDAIVAQGGSGRILQFDISDRTACKTILEKDVEDFGAYYGVVCNAGIARDGAFPALSEDDWDQVMSTNLDGFYNVLHPIMMPMIRRKSAGRIVTLSSVSGIMGNRGQVNYSAAKAGIIGATKALAVELAKRKITVNCVAPGMIDTDMISDAPMEEALKLIPMNRVGKIEEVAALVNFLMSEEASYITRQVISVNGGML